ncbi:hypothetical protein ACHAWF_010004 [Thalassiosira exigua]
MPRNESRRRASPLQSSVAPRASIAGGLNSCLLILGMAMANVASGASVTVTVTTTLRRCRWRWNLLNKAPAAAFASNSLCSSTLTLGVQSRSASKTRTRHSWRDIHFHTSTRDIRRSASSMGGSSDMTANEMQMKDDALKMVTAAINAVDPNVAVRDRLKIKWVKEQPILVAKADRDANKELIYNLSDYDKVRIISFGKASAAMALAAAEILSDSLSQASIPVPKVDGVVIIKDGHATDDEIRTLEEKHNIIVRSASHPVPDARSVAGANEIFQLASSSDARTLIVACISGGGSALFCSPRYGLTLEDLMATNSRLLESGMPIEHMNVIRKRLENGKGGRLAAEAYPATVVTLVLSDIIGDPLDLIASGPTVPDSSDWNDACSLVEEYGLGTGGHHELPLGVIELLQRGKEGILDDTPKAYHPAFSGREPHDKESRRYRKLHSETVLVGNNYASVMAAADEALRIGYNPVVLGTRVDGEASCVALSYVAMAEMLSRQRHGTDVKYSACALPAALISGGETIVTLPPNCNGKGGRNQELALSAALKMKEMNLRDVILASVGTDGTDGPTDSAGAIVHGGLVNDENIEDVKEALRNHDAYPWLEASKSKPLVFTGPTGTNVADVYITLVR